ncbi:MAG: hypothetical protein HQ557_06050 [Bacteroidetes bacterium]|nr:hypothetical protein [Bacteroidota bacterium]
MKNHTDNLQTVTLKSSNSQLNKGFSWAKEQALSYVSHNDPVGSWYEAALPGRESFCIRDVSHQSTGASVLGLSRITLNMLLRFAENISASRDWCTYWEINKDNQPTPVDYTNDSDFWYNLPANFDLIDCCWRQYLWTGDTRYLTHPVFQNFYLKSTDDYIRRWDSDGDGIPDHPPGAGRRGVASYRESDITVSLGGDLITTQYRGFLAYANILTLTNRRDLGIHFQSRANDLMLHYQDCWWNTKNRSYYASKNHNGNFTGIDLFSALYFGTTTDAQRAEILLQKLFSEKVVNVEMLSHYPEVFYRYGHQDKAYQVLCRLMDPDLKRREYPEVSFSVIGSIASGMFGVSPDAGSREIATLPQLPEDTERAELHNIPVFDQSISVIHIGNRESLITNHSDSVLTWRACFKGLHAKAEIDGTTQALTYDTTAHPFEVSMVRITVQPGQTVRASIITHSH